MNYEQARSSRRGMLLNITFRKTPLEIEAIDLTRASISYIGLFTSV